MLNALIAAHRGQVLGVSSIGLDGEDLDTVTRLPKPQVHLPLGSLVATSEDCLRMSSAVLEVLSGTGIMTGLGQIVLARVTAPGNCLIGGPSTTQGMEHTKALLFGLGAGKVFIDGAFARSSHALAGDGLVYVIGAHASTRMDQVVAQADLNLKRFNLPLADEGHLHLRAEKRPGWLDEQAVFHAITGKDLLAQVPLEARWLYLPGALGPLLARQLVSRRNKHRCGLILKSPLSIVASGKDLQHLFTLNRPIRVLHRLQLPFVAFNPVSPAGYRFDASAFRSALTEITQLPLINALEEMDP